MIIKTHEEITPDSPDSSAKPSLPRVKDMDREDTPREKAERLGCGALSIADLWAIVLRTGTVGNPITQMCRDLMRHNDGKLTVLERRTRQELLQMKGLGPLKVIQIEAVMELIRRYNAETPPQRPAVKQSSDIFAIIKPHIAHLPHEEVWAIILNRSNRVMKLFQASKGGWSASLFDIKVIIKEALLESASAIVLCHNHPSGNLTPSGPDDAITKKCAEACKIMDMILVDHLIVTPHGYYSYTDNGRMP